VEMLGSSRTYQAFDAGRAEALLAATLGRPVVVFNFGISGAGSIGNLVNLNRLLTQGVRPDVVLVEVLPPVLAQTARETGHLPGHRLWHCDLAWLGHYRESFPRARAEWWAASLTPWYAHRFLILNATVPRWLPYYLQNSVPALDAWGWTGGLTRPALTPAQYQHHMALTQHTYGSVLADFHLGGNSAQAVEDLLQLCRQERIATALVLMPEGTKFRSWYPAAAWTQIENYLDELSRRHGVPLINARTWLPDDDFFDSHHALRDGAVAFTERLEREVIAPLARAVLGTTETFAAPSE
jgi:hypothetical protein